jgi:hypothetical protein
MARNGGKWRMFLEERARGRTIRQAAQAAGYSQRQGERICADPDFRQQLARRLDEVAAEDRAAYAEHRRAALAVANASLLKLQQLLSSTGTPPAVEERTARTALTHLRRLFPGPEYADLETELRQLEEAQQQLRAGGRHLYAVDDDEGSWPA